MTTSALDATRAFDRGARTTRRTGGRRRGMVPAHIFLGILVVYFLVPVYWMVVNSSKSAAGLFGGTGGSMWFDKAIDYLPNLQDLFSYDGSIYLHWIGNSALYAIAGGVGSTIVSILAGYGFAKFRFRGRNLMFSLLLGAVMVPLTALVIPTFILMSDAGLTDTVWAVILPSLLNPFGVYLMRVYIGDAVPEELLDAARVDGAGEARTFLQVALPLMRPAIVTVLLLSMVATWNNYFLPLVMLSDKNLYPVTVGIGVWQSLASANNGGGHSLWSLIVMGSLVSVIPLVIAFLTLQRYWRGGLSIGSLK